MQHDRPALLIDGMGTLVSLDAPVPALVKVLQRRFGMAVSEADARHALGAEIAFYRAHMDQGRDAESLADLRARCARVLFGALPLTVSAGDDARTEAQLEALRFTAYDDARPALMSARGHGARVIVVSNWDVSLLEVLERVGLAPLVDAVVTSAAVGARKPGPAIFAHALALAGTATRQARHVGDSLAEDIAGARAFCIRPLLLRRDGIREPGVETIAGLAELTWP
ncbi:MAG TPA: HAD-IA family hydrolase [Solirubrobacteraceae bacterium]|nr:HAD-IA family hydrolase [Solirubrobacteraceae bacterium]